MNLSDDLNKFVDDLPHRLKLEVSLFIHEGTYNNFKFSSKKLVIVGIEYPRDTKRGVPFQI